MTQSDTIIRASTCRSTLKVNLNEGNGLKYHELILVGLKWHPTDANRRYWILKVGEIANCHRINTNNRRTLGFESKCVLIGL